MLEKLKGFCTTSKNFVFDNEFSIYELLLKTMEKVNEIIDNINNKDDYLLKLINLKENSSDITNKRKLDEKGNFTGKLFGRQVQSVLANVDSNKNKIEYLTNQFSDGQTGFVIDGGFFTEDGIKDNYDGGVF